LKRRCELRAVTSPMNIVALVLLLVALVTGIWLAVFYRWGSHWYWRMAAPYLWSLVRLSPEPQYMTGLPLVAQAHVLNFFLLLLVFPFTRLVHAVTLPIAYLWRPWQLVRWHRRGAAAQPR
jgi:nitrate reductase gamma subunit